MDLPSVAVGGIGALFVCALYRIFGPRVEKAEPQSPRPQEVNWFKFDAYRAAPTFFVAPDGSMSLAMDHVIGNIFRIRTVDPAPGSIIHVKSMLPEEELVAFGSPDAKDSVWYAKLYDRVNGLVSLVRRTPAGSINVGSSLAPNAVHALVGNMVGNRTDFSFANATPQGLPVTWTVGTCGNYVVGSQSSLRAPQIDLEIPPATEESKDTLVLFVTSNADYRMNAGQGDTIRRDLRERFQIEESEDGRLVVTAGEGPFTDEHAPLTVTQLSNLFKGPLARYKTVALLSSAVGFVSFAAGVAIDAARTVGPRNVVVYNGIGADPVATYCFTLNRAHEEQADAAP